MPCIACFIMRHDIAAKQPGQNYQGAASPRHRQTQTVYDLPALVTPFPPSPRRRRARTYPLRLPPSSPLTPVRGGGALRRWRLAVAQSSGGACDLGRAAHAAAGGDGIPAKKLISGSWRGVSSAMSRFEGVPAVGRGVWPFKC